MRTTQQTLEVTCSRCSGTRWIPVPYIPLDDRGRLIGPPRDLREPNGRYTCYRCRKVLAGAPNVADPRVSPERRARLVELARTHRIGTTSDSAGRSSRAGGPVHDGTRGTTPS